MSKVRISSFFGPRLFINLLIITWLYSGLACSGGTGLTGTGDDTGGTGTGEDGTGSGGSTADPLYEAGPIDIPVPIAKVEAPNPSRITVTVSGDTVSLVGEEGALPDNASCSQVYTYDTSLELQQTATYRSGGRFDEIVFTYNGQSSITTSIIVACFDGTSIGSPIFLKIEEGSFIWLLTNGAEVSDGALSVYGDTVYLVSETDASTSISKRGGTDRDLDCSGVESTLYSLAIGGNYEEVASGCFAIDQVFGLSGAVIARSGSTFYRVADSEFDEACSLSLSSGEAIDIVAVAYDVENSMTGLNVATNQGVYYCNVFEYSSSESFSTSFSLQSNWEVVALGATDNTTAGMGFNIAYSVVDTSTDKQVSPTGGSIASFDPFGAVTTGTLKTTASGVTPQMDLIALSFTEGLSSNVYTTFENVTQASSGTAGSSSATAFAIYSGLNTSYYFLDASLTIASNGTSSAGGTSYSVYNLLDLTTTRTIHDVQVHPSGYVALFCADDSSGSGQIYAYCPALLPSSGAPDGNEIIQLTNGSEHCDERNNWTVDNSASDGALVVVSLSNPETPQIRFIDPMTDPLLADCFP